MALKFKNQDWFGNPEIGVIDTVLELCPDFFHLFKSDIIVNDGISSFGRKDTPSVEQIVRAWIFKKIIIYDFRELGFAQSDSRICATFIKLDEREPFCFQTFQKYISRISEETLHKVLVSLQRIIRNSVSPVGTKTPDSR